MNNVLYEVSPNFNYSWLIIPVIVLFVLAILCPIFIKRRYEKENIELTIKTKLIFAGAILFAIISTLVITAAFYRFEKGIYDQTVVSYYNGEYLEVEGYIENFDSQIIRGEVSEEFEINGVKFSYTNASSPIGYYDAIKNIIIGDGQHLKIRYANLGMVYGNVILYIEKIPD